MLKKEKLETEIRSVLDGGWVEREIDSRVYSVTF